MDTYKDVTSLDHRILLEADFLVNSFEDHLAPEGIITFRNHRALCTCRRGCRRGFGALFM